MTNKFPPALIVLTMVFLSITAFVGAMSASADFGRWRVIGGEIVPVWAILKVIVLALIPTLAVIDLYFRRPSGRYLALIPMLWLFGLCLRLFVGLLLTADLYINRSPQPFLFLNGSLTFFLAAAISSLALSKTVRSYLNS
ncbi:MAG: hypothetical protein QM785_03310 [Pyrinomonadaceae bacterium]